MPNLVDPNADTEQKMDIYIYTHIKSNNRRGGGVGGRGEKRTIHTVLGGLKMVTSSVVRSDISIF